LGVSAQSDDEHVHSPFPDNSLSKELQAYIAEVLGSHNAVKDSWRIDELVRLCRSTALKYEAYGHPDEAQKWRNDANRLNEAAAIESELADTLRAHLNNNRN
jgi:hypothetical protein